MKTLYASGSTLSPREREGVRMRLAHLAGCNHCLRMRMDRDMPEFSAEPIPEGFFAHVLTPDLWDGYTARERAAITFAERYANDPDGLNGDDALWRDLDELFTPAEIGDLCGLGGAWLGAGRTLTVLGLAEHCAIPGGPTPTPKMNRILASALAPPATDPPSP